MASRDGWSAEAPGTTTVPPSFLGVPPAAGTPKIVAVGGGTGLPAVIEGLCDLWDEDGIDASPLLTAVVTVTDDGGSSGQLRRARGIPPPGDARNCLAAAVRADSPFRTLLRSRTDHAHPVGNLLLAALTEITGDFTSAVEALGRAMDVRGDVFPSTASDVRLRAEFHSGEMVDGETAIVARRARIRRLTLQPSPRPLPQVLRALVNADAIVVGPGSLYTSVLPNLLVEGVAATIYGVNAVRIYVANLMTEPGETDDYSLDDHLEVIRTHTGFDLFDYIIVPRLRASADLLRQYASRGSYPVRRPATLAWSGGARVIECDVTPECHGTKLRHDPRALALAIRQVITAGR